MTRLPFLDADPAHTGFQYLEDLAVAYWYSEVLFAALRLKLFDHLENGPGDCEAMALASGCDPAALSRLLAALGKLELTGESDGKWFNSQAAGKYLVTTGSHYLGDFLLYRQCMQTKWASLISRLSKSTHSQLEKPDIEEDYLTRNFRYVRAMDALAREKARNIVELIPGESWQPPVLDIGGGAGALCRALIRTKPEGEAHLFELPEVIAAAQKIHPGKDDWQRINLLSGDFRTYRFPPGQKFGLILMGNFLHAYGASEARRLLVKAVSLLTPTGLLVVHDYFPDLGECSPHKGALYDLAMMLNTYDGVCHRAEEVSGWLEAAGMGAIWRRDLGTDSALILAAGPEAGVPPQPLESWTRTARSIGFRRAVAIPARDVVVAPWVRIKCRNGCPGYGRKLQCPPDCIEPDQTQRILDAYGRAILVEGAPPGKAFHEKLLTLERKAFLSGFHKALAFGAGPCPVCDACPDDGVCRLPEKARPSMEGAGMDVYETARKAGLSIEPVPRKGDYVKYIGLLLLE